MFNTQILHVIMYLSLNFSPRIERAVLWAVPDVATVVGEAPFFTQLLKFVAVVFREAPSLGDIDLRQ